MDEKRRFQRIDELFRAALKLPLEGREAFIEIECEGDTSVRDEVITLLRNDEQTRFLDEPVTPPDLPHRSEPVDSIGPYRIVRRIGEGGMGAVYEAEQTSPRRTVALKVIRAGYLSDELRRRFELESTVLGRLQHPGIAQVYEAGTSDSGEPYFAMELIRGVPLLEHAERARLPLEQRLELITLVCDAVEHAHQKGVIHRDLKPSNILVQESARSGSGALPEVGQPKILDFGVARAIDSDVQAVTVQTDVGQLIGTVQYMSPEQASGDPKAVDTRSDIYSIGVILYELLTGSRPIELKGRSIIEAARLVREHEPTRLGTVDRRLRGDIETICSKALEKDKEHRYQSASQLAADLRRFLADEPIAARPPSTIYQLRKFARRNKVLVGATAVIALALIAATSVSTVFAIRADRDRAIAEERFGDVRELTNTLLFGIYDSIADLPGATEARELLARTGVEYLDSLAEQASDDPILLSELTGGYMRLGSSVGSPRSASTGDTAAALDIYEKALTHQRRIAELTDKPFDLLKVAGILKTIAEVHMVMGQPDRARERVEEAVQIGEVLREIVHREPDERNRYWIRRDAMNSFGLLGEVLAREGKQAEASEMMERQLELARALIETTPDPERARRDLAIALSDSAAALASIGEVQEAYERELESVAIRRDTAAANQGQRRPMRDLVLGLSRLGNRQMSAGEYADALETYLEGVDRAQELVDADDADSIAKFDLAVLAEKSGQAYLELDRPVEAVPLLERCVVLRRESVATDGANLRKAFALGSGLAYLGDAHLDTGNSARAIELYRECVQTFDDVIARDQRYANPRGLQIIVLFRLGEIYAGRVETDVARDIAEAGMWYTRTQAALESMSAEGMTLPSRVSPEMVDAAMREVSP